MRLNTAIVVLFIILFDGVVLALAYVFTSDLGVSFNRGFTAVLLVFLMLIALFFTAAFSSMITAESVAREADQVVHMLDEVHRREIGQLQAKAQILQEERDAANAELHNLQFTNWLDSLRDAPPVNKRRLTLLDHAIERIKDVITTSLPRRHPTNSSKDASLE